MDFMGLVSGIRHIHEQLSNQTKKAVNRNLTLRNWLIGLYIFEFELNGSDRATYGDRLLEELSLHLSTFQISNCNKRQLYRYLSFYRVYPEIVGTLSPQLKRTLIREIGFGGKPGGPPREFPIIPIELLNQLSYSHLEQLVAIDNDLKRKFYENECISGNWSVRELKRQISSLYFERSKLSTDKRKLARIANRTTESEPALTVRDPYVFEFLGLKPREVVQESDLEEALLSNVQEFMLEMGNGFCFEARQKRILIGGKHYFIDLVFYHRILKCHVLIELKLAEFTHEYVGQLNTYVNWYRRNVMAENDNPPVGILLCTNKDQPLVEYALAGMNNQLFVSKYELELPGKKDIQEFLRENISNETWRIHGIKNREP